MSATINSGEKGVNSHTNDLSRQVTLQLSSEQYERLFFQPSQSKGDLSRRLGNPTLLGVLGFMIPFTSIVLSFLQFEGSSVSSVTAISGSFYFFGGIAMNIAGIAEFILGNTFPFVAFVVYGTHWVVLAYLSDPSKAIVASYGAEGAGELSQAYNAGQGNYSLVMAIVSFVFLCGSIRTNVPFVILFLGLVLLFGFVSAAYYQLGYNPTPQGLLHTIHYFRIAGGFGFVSMTSGWYLTLIQVFETTGVPVPLPIFDLSQKVFPDSAKGQKTEHAG